MKISIECYKIQKLVRFLTNLEFVTLPLEYGKNLKKTIMYRTLSNLLPVKFN